MIFNMSRSASIIPLYISTNGTYTATGADGYSPITVNVSGGGTGHTVTSYDGAEIFYQGIYHEDGDYVELVTTDSLTLPVGAMFVLVSGLENVICYSPDSGQEYETWWLDNDIQAGVMPDADIVVEHE